MRLLKITLAAIIALAVLPSLLAPAADPSNGTLADVEACSRREDAIKEYPAACYVAIVLQKIAGKPANEAVKIIDEAIKNTPAPARLATPALENIKDNLVFNDLVKSLKEAEDFLDSCNKGDVATCAAAAQRLLDYSGAKLLNPAIDRDALLKALTGAKLQADETARGANADIQLVAGWALANVLQQPVGFPEGCIKYGKIPGAPGDETGLIVSGKTPYARAACSDMSVGQTLNNWIPPRGIDAPKTRALYARLTDAENKGKMELAYMLARVYVFLLKGNFVERGLDEAIRRSDDCLSGGNLVLGGFSFECGKYKSLRLAVATDFQSGFFRFFGDLANVSCDDLRQRAETGISPIFPDRGAWAGIRLAAAITYVSGRVVPPGVELKCIDPYNKASLVKLAREGKSPELRAESAGDVWAVYDVDNPSVPAGKPIGYYLSPRGLSALLLEAGDADEALLNDPAPEVRLAAWLVVGGAWARSQLRASAWNQALNGKNEAHKRAGALAYFFPRGLDLVRTYMEPISQGGEAVVDQYQLDGTKAPVSRGVAIALAPSESKRPIDELIKETSLGDGRATLAGLALARALVERVNAQGVRDLVNQYPSGVPRTDGFPVKEPLTAALVESFGTRIKESIKP